MYLVKYIWCVFNLVGEFDLMHFKYQFWTNISYKLQPDKRMSLNCKGKDNAKPPLPTMSEYDDIKEVNKQNEDKGQIRDRKSVV